MTPRPPYFSQWGELGCNHALIERGEDPALVHDWTIDGYPSAEAYRLWSLNTCGLACLQSVLATRDHAVPRKFDLIEQATQAQAFVPRDDGRIDGLYYQPFVDWITAQYGIEADVRRVLDVQEIHDLITTGQWFVMASVSSEIRWPTRQPTRRGGHLVLVHGTEDDHLIFHNPSGLGPTAADARCTTTSFARFFAGRGIMLRRTA